MAVDMVSSREFVGLWNCAAIVGVKVLMVMISVPMACNLDTNLSV